VATIFDMAPITKIATANKASYFFRVISFLSFSYIANWMIGLLTKINDELIPFHRDKKPYVPIIYLAFEMNDPPV
jgi:hypothetical protein